MNKAWKTLDVMKLGLHGRCPRHPVSICFVNKSVYKLQGVSTKFAGCLVRLHKASLIVVLAKTEPR